MRAVNSLALHIALLGSFGCASTFDVDSEVVNTPVHDDTKVFYLDTIAPDANNRGGQPEADTAQRGRSATEYIAPRRVSLFRPYERSETQTSGLVEHGDPVSIVVNKVVLPRHLFDTSRSDPRDNKTYDIAVILDIAALDGENKTSIAVFYQRGVKANSSLSFENLLVYSQDTWDNRIPPYFRVRIFNVANERNQRTKEVLEQVQGLSGAIAEVAGSPFAEPVIQVAARAAELVLIGNNEMLVDFQFQLYSTAQSSQSGGMPLGLFRKGGLALVGVPRGEERQYWGDKRFVYDFATEEILEKKAEELTPIDVPFLLATVITTDTVVPNVVKRRSSEIFKILRNDEALRSDFEQVEHSVERLRVALRAMRERERFATNPTKDTFRDYLAAIRQSQVGGGAKSDLEQHEQLVARYRSLRYRYTDDQYRSVQ